jgi:hypothetical protein
MSANGPALPRFLGSALAIVSMAVAARLFLPAAMLTFSQRSIVEFNSTGLPAWIRPALALPEMCGAVLFAIPRTFYLGAILLLLDLTGAVAAHLSIGVRPTGLYVLMVVVSLLSLLRMYFSPWKPQH